MVRFIYVCVVSILLCGALCRGGEQSLRDVLINILQQHVSAGDNQLHTDKVSGPHQKPNDFKVSATDMLSPQEPSGAESPEDGAAVIGDAIEVINKEIMDLEFAYETATRYIGPNKEIHRGILEVLVNPEIPEEMKVSLVDKLKEKYQPVPLEDEDVTESDDSEVSDENSYDELVRDMNKAAAKLVRVRAKVTEALNEMQKEKELEFPLELERVEHFLSILKNLRGKQKATSNKKFGSTENGNSLDEKVHDGFGEVDKPTSNAQAQLSDELSLMGQRNWHNTHCSAFKGACGGWSSLCCPFGTIDGSQTFPMCCKFIVQPKDRLKQLLPGSEQVTEGICLPNPFGSGPCAST